jgi:hypothetical protein
MKKIALTAVLIISVMFMVSCNGCKKDNVEQYKDTTQYKNIEQFAVEEYRYAEEKVKDMYDAVTGLDYTGAVKYTVKKGDTLSNISRRVYNDGFYYPVIMLASRGVVVNPDKIEPGMELTVPDLEINKANVNCRKSIKNCLNGIAELEKIKPTAKKALIDGLKKRADAL